MSPLASVLLPSFPPQDSTAVVTLSLKREIPPPRPQYPLALVTRPTNTPSEPQREWFYCFNTEIQLFWKERASDRAIEVRVHQLPSHVANRMIIFPSTGYVLACSYINVRFGADSELRFSLPSHQVIVLANHYIDVLVPLHS